MYSIKKSPLLATLLELDFFQPNVLEIHFFYLFLSNIFISHSKSSSKKLGVLSLTYNKNSSEKVKKNSSNNMAMKISNIFD